MQTQSQTPGQSRQPKTYGELLDGESASLERVSVTVMASGGVLELGHAQNGGTERWALEDLRIVPDQARADAIILARSDTHPARLIIRERELMREILLAAPNIRDLGRQSGVWPRLAAVTAAAFAAMAALIFIAVPYMADNVVEVLPPEVEVALGERAMTMFYDPQSTRICSEPQGLAALNQITERLTEGLEHPYNLQIRVVNDPLVNAFALPGGQIVLHEGLIRTAEAPEEVAGVIAHEIGHVINRDGTRATLRAMGSWGLVGLFFGDVFGGSVAVGATQALISSSHSREAETRADEFAHQMMHDAGLPATALGDMFLRMQAAGLDTDLGVMQHFSSHPEMLERIEAASAAGEAHLHGGPALSDAEWQALQNICNQSQPIAASASLPAPGPSVQPQTDGDK